MFWRLLKVLEDNANLDTTKVITSGRQVRNDISSVGNHQASLNITNIILQQTKQATRAEREVPASDGQQWDKRLLTELLG